MTRPLENWVKGFLNDKTSRELGQVIAVIEKASEWHYSG